MFGLVSSLVRRWRERTLHKRAFFRFHDGRRWRYVDPFKAWRELNNHPDFDFASQLKFVDVGESDSTEACVKALCGVFAVERWNEQTGDGLTDWELLNVLDAFYQYCAAVKKNISPGPTESEPTDPASSTFPAPPAAASSACSGSPSTPIASSFDTPCESSTGSKADSPTNSS